MRFLGVLWQIVIMIVGATLLIGVTIAIWYGFSYLVLLLVSKVFRLRGRPPKD